MRWRQLRNVELQLLQPRVERRVVRADEPWRRIVGPRHAEVVEDVGNHQQLLLRQIRHQQVLGVAVLDVIDVHPARAVADDVLILVLQPDEVRFLGRLRQRIRVEGVRRLQHDVLVKLPVHLVRDDRRSFGDERPQSGGMIRVVMRVDVIRDRLAGHQAMRLRDVRQRAPLGHGRLDDDEEVLELDELTVGIGRAAEIPDAVGHLRRLDARRLRAAGRRLQVHRGVRFDRCDVQLQHRIDPLLLDDARGELHAVEVAVVAEGGLNRHVAERRLRRPGFDLLNQVLRVDVAVDLVLVLHRERDHGHRLAAAA